MITIALSLIHTLCSSLQHIWSLPSLLYLHQLSPGNGFQCCSFHVQVLTGQQLSHNSLIAPTLLVIKSRHSRNIENTPFPTVILLLCAYSLPRKRVYRAIAQKWSLFTESPLSNGSIHHNMNNIWYLWKSFSTLSHYSLMWPQKIHIGSSLNGKILQGLNICIYKQNTFCTVFLNCNCLQHSRILNLST
jgi:hypothetical protein